MFRIQLDWPQQEPLNFLFSCLHWSFALGAIFSLAVITAERSHINKIKSFVTVNIIGITAIVITFILLYLLSGLKVSGARYEVLSSVAETRVSVAILVSFIAFIIFAGYSIDGSDFTASLFMTHKAFFIALIYGAVIMLGASLIARAVQSLLYHEMSSKVYMYIGTISGFLAYTIFLGYFPDFRKGKGGDYREAVQRQPRFIEILFQYIMIPIVLILTLVLLVWAAKTVFSGMQVQFVRLSVIAASYTIGGLWLYAMVDEHKSAMARAYRFIYPAASFIILIFEAWAVIKQLELSGLKTTEYIFIIIWILASASAVLLLILKSKAHKRIAVLICALAILSVLPIIGYQDLPVTAQVSRLRDLLISQEMLKDNTITKAETEPQESVRIAITDAVSFLSSTENAKLPDWFNKNLAESNEFENKFGFKQTWAKPDNSGPISAEYSGTFLYLSSGSIDISDYTWAVSPQNNYRKTQDEITLDGNRGKYHILWTTDTNTGIPSLKILLDDRVIINESFKDYIDSLIKKYPPAQAEPRTTDLADMSLRLESPEIEVLVVFSYIEIGIDTTNGVTNYGLDLKDLYIKEKA